MGDTDQTTSDQERFQADMGWIVEHARRLANRSSSEEHGLVPQYLTVMFQASFARYDMAARATTVIPADESRRAHEETIELLKDIRQELRKANSG